MPMLFPFLFFVVVATATGYVPSAGGRNCNGDCSTTASGLPPSSALASCGWGWELGQKLYVPDYGAVICGDRFGTRAACERIGIGLYAVDLFFTTEAEALQWGRKKTVLYVIQ